MAEVISETKKESIETIPQERKIPITLYFTQRGYEYLERLSKFNRWDSVEQMLADRLTCALQSVGEELEDQLHGAFDSKLPEYVDPKSAKNYGWMIISESPNTA